jgi:hypothetical protein
MSIHAKRAAVVIAVLAISPIVSPGWCITLLGLIPLGLPGGALPRLVVLAMILGVLVYWVSKWRSQTPVARR